MLFSAGPGRGHRVCAASQHLHIEDSPKGSKSQRPTQSLDSPAASHSASVLGPRAPKLCPSPTVHQAYPAVTAPARVRDQPKRTCGTWTLSPRAVRWARRPEPQAPLPILLRPPGTGTLAVSWETLGDLSHRILGSQP